MNIVVSIKSYRRKKGYETDLAEMCNKMMDEQVLERLADDS